MHAAHWPAIFRLMRLHQPIGIFLLLWPVLWALWLASDGHPAPRLVVIFVLGTLVMRSAGCVINDIADRKFDGQVERTQHRPLATGEVSLRKALIIFCVLMVMALCLVLQLNEFCIRLAFIGASLTVVYPFMKRYTYLPQLILGATFNWGIILAFAAQCDRLPGLAWCLYGLALLWTLAYDTMYAMVDREDDRRLGIKSTALLFGRYDRMIIAILQGLMLFGLIGIGWVYALKWPYYIGLCIATSFAIYQQSLLKNRLPKPCFQAFLNNHWFGMAIFAGLLSHFIVI